MGLMGVHVTEKEKLTDTVSGPTLQLIFQGFPLATFWCRVKEERPLLPETTLFFGRHPGRGQISLLDFN